METYLNRSIKEIISQFPGVVDILKEYNIGCTLCSIGTCLLKDIVQIHNLSPEEEQELMVKIARVIYPGQKVDIHEAKKRHRVRPEEFKYSPPMQKLVEEHSLIKRWIALIPAVIDNLDTETERGRRIIFGGVDFIRTFADRYHHAKEENILFKYFDENLDILKAMHADHEAARSHVRAIVDAIEKKDGLSLSEHLNAYKGLLTEHIKKENEILYPWMDRNLTITQVGKLFSKFNKVDQDSPGVPDRYEKFITELERRFT